MKFANSQKVLTIICITKQIPGCPPCCANLKIYIFRKINIRNLNLKFTLSWPFLVQFVTQFGGGKNSRKLEAPRNHLFSLFDVNKRTKLTCRWLEAHGEKWQWPWPWWPLGNRRGVTLIKDAPRTPSVKIA